MYLEYYSIKRFFFFLSFGENFVIFLILTLFVSFGGKTMVKLCFNKTHFLNLKLIFLMKFIFLNLKLVFLRG